MKYMWIHHAFKNNTGTHINSGIRNNTSFHSISTTEPFTRNSLGYWWFKCIPKWCALQNLLQNPAAICRTLPSSRTIIKYEARQVNDIDVSHITSPNRHLFHYEFIIMTTNREDYWLSWIVNSSNVSNRKRCHCNWREEHRHSCLVKYHYCIIVFSEGTKMTSPGINSMFCWISSRNTMSS